MRILLSTLLALFAVATMANGQTETDDPYSINLVSAVWKMNRGGQHAITGWSQKGLARLGDGISIAILKILPEDEFANPQTVKDFLPIIRDSFSQPQLISLPVNKDPRVTIFLLNHLLRNATEPVQRQGIQQTIDYVRGQTSGSASIKP